MQDVSGWALHPIMDNISSADATGRRLRTCNKPRYSSETHHIVLSNLQSTSRLVFGTGKQDQKATQSGELISRNRMALNGISDKHRLHLLSGA